MPARSLAALTDAELERVLASANGADWLRSQLLSLMLEQQYMAGAAADDDPVRQRCGLLGGTDAASAVACVEPMQVALERACVDPGCGRLPVDIERGRSAVGTERGWPAVDIERELPAVDSRLPSITDDRGGEASLAGMGAGDLIPPGPVLAWLLADTWEAGLDGLPDDELVGVLRAARRLGSWAAALELSAAGDLMRRRMAEEAAGRTGVAEHVGDEVAAELTLTGRAAERLIDQAMALSRLPATMRALAEGRIDVPRAYVIAEEVSGLSDLHAAIVELAVIRDAPEQTTSQLRAGTRRAVIAADPAAVRRRKEQAQREARVERWDEPAGTAGLAGRDLPAPDVLAADSHISALARELRAAGVEGSMDNLRAQVFLALLAGRSPYSLIPAHPGGPGVVQPHADANSAGTRADGPGVTGSVNLTMPLATWLGLSSSPGDVVGYGPLDASDSRALAERLAADPATRWCLTLTDSRGHAVAHGCARTGPGGSRGSRPGPTTASPNSPDGAVIAAWLSGVKLSVLETGQCTHERESRCYRPPPSLQHLIQIRQRTCSFPGCRRPATRCDADHTLAFDRGGRTCECNLAPLCRRHHRAKQAHGWRLEQPQPGVLVWTLPSGRAYTTTPTSYPSG